MYKKCLQNLYRQTTIYLIEYGAMQKKYYFALVYVGAMFGGFILL